jgi:3-oxoacyl-[acyl-carrier protein] reductase/pteridine reductase
MRHNRRVAIDSKPLAGKTALVTGGARRIGHAIALRLASAGANVAITWRNSSAEAAETLRLIEECGVDALSLRCEITDEASVASAIHATIERFGGVDLLINNAAVFESAPLESITVEQWDRVFDTNVRGPFLTARAAHTSLRERHGRIVNIGSLGGRIPFAGHAHYSASKAALHMLTLTMAKAWAPEISVNCVAPGWIALEDAPQSEQSQAAHFAAKTPMQRNGSAKDVAEAVLHFATCSHFVTGQTLTVDGGLGLTS